MEIPEHLHGVYCLVHLKVLASGGIAWDPLAVIKQRLLLLDDPVRGEREQAVSKMKCF
jgi:hypothetical protein